MKIMIRIYEVLFLIFCLVFIAFPILAQDKVEASEILMVVFYFGMSVVMFFSLRNYNRVKYIAPLFLVMYLYYSIEGLLVYISGFGFTAGLLPLILFYISCPAIIINSIFSYYKLSRELKFQVTKVKIIERISIDLINNSGIPENCYQVKIIYFLDNDFDVSVSSFFRDKKESSMRPLILDDLGDNFIKNFRELLEVESDRKWNTLKITRTQKTGTSYSFEIGVPSLDS